jgi:hypothetical protein
VRAENEHFGAAETRRIPAHADVLAQPEKIAGRLGEQHLRREWQESRGAGCMGRDRVDFEAGGLEYRGERDIENGVPLEVSRVPKV